MTGKSGRRPRLIVFGDDWGRHQSSAQFLARVLLERYDIEWIETVGTRRPRLTLADGRRGMEKLGQWFRPPRRRAAGRGREHRGLRIHAPLMWPSFRTKAARAANAAVLGRTLRGILAERERPQAILSTVPLVADLARVHPNQHWIYYCVDALHDWEELDRPTLDAMEREWVPRCSRIVAASEALAQRLVALGPSCEVSTVSHGVDYEAWNVDPRVAPTDGQRPMALFFGAVDERIDPALCERIAAEHRLVMVGPQGRAPRALRGRANIELWGQRPHETLPALAASAHVLVLPYRDTAATDKLEPLKLKEYLSTRRPVVTVPLRATAAWSGGLDLAGDPEAFVRLVRERAASGLPADQLRFRERLRGESWKSKAKELEMHFAGPRAAEPGPVTVLHVRSCAGSGSGPEKTLLRSHLHLDPACYRIVVALLCDPDDRAVDGVLDEARRLGADFRRVADRGPLDRTVLENLLRIASECRAEVWHGHDAKSNVLGLRARRRLPLRLVATAHGWVHRTRRTPLYDRLDRWAIRRGDGVICVSQATAGELGIDAGSKARVEVIPNGVELEGAAAPRERTAEDALFVGVVGRLEAEKGIEHLLRAVARLRESGVDLRLRIYGEGSLEGALKAQAQGLEIEDAVEWHGFESNRERIFAGLDAFALPSLREGTPNSLLEAMACGLPIVASRTGGVPELVEGDTEALLVPPGDPRALAVALARIAREPAWAQQLGLAARRAAAERHGFVARMARVARFYDGILGAVGS